MNTVEKVLWESLLYNIKLDEDYVRVLVNSRPFKDNTPCITISSEEGASVHERFLDTEYYSVSKSHYLYDKDNPNKKYAFEVSRQQKSIESQINIWCNTEEERHILIKQVEDILNGLQNYDYRFCTNYIKKEKQCKSLKKPCTALNDIHSRGKRKQCPNPVEYNYSNTLIKNRIIPYTFKWEDSFNVDDTTVKPIVLHSIFKVNMDYYNTYLLGGNPTNDIILNF